MLRDCPIDHRCMTAITPADVFERARMVLETANRRRENSQATAALPVEVRNGRAFP